MKMLLAGGTGGIGKILIPFLLKNGHEVNVQTRRKKVNVRNIHYCQWDLDEGFIGSEAFVGVDALENITMNEFSNKMLHSFGRRKFWPNIPV